MVAAGHRGHVISLSPQQQLSVFEVTPGRKLGAFEVTTDHVRQLGTFLAMMHLAARDLGRRRRNAFNPDAVRELVEICEDATEDEDRLGDLKVLRLELRRHQWSQNLPRGIIHSHLGLGSTLFERGQLTGALDFEDACSGPLSFDLAAVAGEWAFVRDEFRPDLARALFEGYALERSLTPLERRNSYELLRFALARFAASCYHDFEVRKPVVDIEVYRDYGHFLERLASLTKFTSAAFFELCRV